MASTDISIAVTAGKDGGESAVPSYAPAALELPSIEQTLADLPESSDSLPSRSSDTLAQEEQEKMFRALKHILDNFHGSDESSQSFDLKELHSSLEQADEDARRGQRDVSPLQKVIIILHNLWAANSGLLSQAAEALANGSRDREFPRILWQQCPGKEPSH